MSTDEPDFAAAGLDDEAAAWLCERAEGFSPTRAQEFADWRNRDPRHAAAVARVERCLELLDDMPAVRGRLEARVGAVPGASMNLRRYGRTRRLPRGSWLALAAAATLMIGAAWWPGWRPGGAEEHYATESVAQRRVVLRDGSTLDLNGASEVNVHFTKRERRVTLGGGEAHFQVAHDAKRPFVVAAGGMTVRAVGTAFTVRLAAGAVDVVVVEGRVELSRESAPAEAGSLLQPQLSAGERASVRRDEPVFLPAVERVDAAAIRAVFAWQDPVTTFSDVPLREVVARFNQRNITQLVLADEQLGERRIGGVIALNQVDAFVRLLEQDGDVVARRTGSNEIVLRLAR